MDARRDKLPPSPPTTDSSTKSTRSSPSLLSAVSPSAESPPLSPDTVRSHHNKSPRSSAPLAPLPSEVFLSIIKFLPPAEQVRACLVSRSWHAFIVGEPQFWSKIKVSLEDDDLELFQQALFRAVGNGNKKRAGLESLTIWHRGVFDARTGRWGTRIPTQDAMDRLEQVFECATQASTATAANGDWLADPETERYSTLRSLRLALRADHADTVYLLHTFAKLARACLLFNLETLIVDAALPDFVLAYHILPLIPTVRNLKLRFNCRSQPRNCVVDPGNWIWHQPHREIRGRHLQLNHLGDLTIESAAIMQNLFVPASLPALKKLTLQNTSWQGKGLFRLLRIARRTLEHLELHNFTFDAVLDQDLYADYCDNVDVRDPYLVDGELSDTPQDEETLDLEPPPPIHLSNLRVLRLSGSTPPLFANLQYSENEIDTEEYPTPAFWMPRLECAHFEETNVDPDIPESDDPAPLTSLGRNAPNVEHLVLSSCSVRDEVVFECLAAMQARVTSLDLYDSTVSDHLLSYLPQIVPRLRSLDVRSCPDVSCQGLARLVEVVRHLGDEGQCRVDQVWIDEPRYSEHDSRAWRWLDFIGVLHRGEDDFAGLGPADARERRVWIKEGKKDRVWEWKEQCRKRDDDLAVAKARLAQEMMLGGGVRGEIGSTSSASSVLRGGANDHSLPMAPTFAAPSLHRNPARAPIGLEHSTVVLPSLPTVSHLEVSPHPTQRCQFPAVQPASTYATPAPDLNARVNVAHPTQESKLDLTSLDSIADLNQLDPALVREQELALEQIKRSLERSRSGRGGASDPEGPREAMPRLGGGGRLSEREAYEAAQREAHRRTAPECDAMQDFAHREQTVYAVTGRAATVPSTDSQTDKLVNVQRAGGFVRSHTVSVMEEEESDSRGVDDDEEEGGGGGFEDDLGAQWREDQDDLFNFDDDASNDTDALHPTALR